MKGMVATANFLRGVLNKEKGLRSGKTPLHVYIHQVKGYDRIFFVSDPAFNMYPDIKVKVDIVKNVVELAHAFGVACPEGRRSRRRRGSQPRLCRRPSTPRCSRR